MTESPKPLGRKAPSDWEHYDKYRLTVPQTASSAERSLYIYPTWRQFYDQGREGACVGYSVSQMMSILNRRRYDARWLWNEAKKIDEWTDTNPGDSNGTSVRAAMDVLRTQGHSRFHRGKFKPVEFSEGIFENRWATNVDELRTCIAEGIPVVLGTNWYTRFDKPTPVGKEYWLAQEGDDLGGTRGGHAYLLNAVSDRRQAFRTPNTWGLDWPTTGQPGAWIPFSAIQRLINEDGEATLIVDRIDS